MDFNLLTVKNFLSIGDASPLKLDNKGLVLIQGINEDDTSANSNGVGKSSIVDALCWCVYGTTARGVSGDAVVNKVAKKNCSVQTIISDSGMFYRITRYRKDKDFKNQTIVETTNAEGGTWINISKGTEKETQELIDEIMGCSLDVFMAAIYAGQEVTPDLPKMTDKQLKLLIEEAAGVERLEGAYEIARKKHGSAKDALTVIEAHIESAKNRISDTESELTTKKLDAEAFESGRAARANEWVNAANTTKSRLVAILLEIKGFDQVGLTERSSELGKLLAGHSALVSKRDSLTTKLKGIQRNLDISTARAETLTSEFKKLRGVLDNAEEELKKPCPTCGRPGETHGLDDYKAHVTVKLKEKAAELKEIKAKVSELTVSVDEMNAEIAAVVMPDVSEISLESQQINETLRKIADLKVKVAKEKAAMDQELKNSEDEMTAVNPHQSAIEMLIERGKKQKDIYEGYLADLDKKRIDVGVFESVSKVFSPAGVRAHILDTVTPFLNDRTSDYLSALSDGNIQAIWTTLASTSKGELREKFNIEVSNDKGAESFMGLSGGEKRKVRLATMLALQDLVASRASKPINIWIGDEVDDALDRSGLERLMVILERKARERGTVLVVSHSDLRDWIDSVVTVTKSGGQSLIDGALI